MKTIKATFLLMCVSLGTCALAQSKSITKDFDGDGYFSYEHGGNDCDDLNWRINPGSEPNLDGGDCNCNGIPDYQESVFNFGDVNRSEKIDAADLAVILEEFGNIGGSMADVNRDLRVDNKDIESMQETHNSLQYGF